MASAPHAPRGLGARLARNSLHSASGRVVALFAWLALTPALVRGLGPEGFGVWSLFFALTGWMGALDLGFSQVALRNFLRGFASGFDSRGSLYRSSPLESSAMPLLMGTWQHNPAEPVAWTNSHKGGRVFYTSLGHREDVWDPDWTDKNGKRENSREVSQAYQKHILGGIQWALGLEKGDATPQTK